MPKTKNNQIVCINQATTSLASYQVPIALENFDSFIVNSISYQNFNFVNGLYMLWCNQTNGYIATFTIPFYMYGNTYNSVDPMVPCASIVPNLEIQIMNPTNQLKFQS